MTGAASASAFEPAPRASVLHQIAIVALYEIRLLVTTIRAAFLVIVYGFVAGSIGAFYLWVDRQSEGQLAEVAKRASALSPEEKAQIISQLGDKIGRPLAEAMVNGDLPPLVLFVLFFSTFAIPGLVLLVGYGSIADDLQSRFARYVLQRIRRESYVIGKLAGHFVVSYAAVLLVHVLLLAYASTTSSFELDKTLHALPRIWLAMAFFVLSYVCFSALFSAVVSPPFGALALGGMALLFLWALSFSALGGFWMGAWHMQLWALDSIAILVYLGHAIVLGGLAYLGLVRRDV